MQIEFKIAGNSPPKEEKLPYSIVFIDYEYLYISFDSRYSCPPMLEEICNEIKQHGKVAKIYAFGDFSSPALNGERNRVRTITSNIIDCANESTMLKKDFTDFIMLDTIYQELIQNPAIEQFIFVTGDGHFSSAATFLRNFMGKTVGVYGVNGSLSRQLIDCSSWAKVITAIDGDEQEYQRNLLRNLKKAEDRGTIATFLKSVEHTVRAYGGDEYRYEEMLRRLIDTQHVNSVTTRMNENREIKILVADWDKVRETFGDIFSNKKL